MTAVLVLITLAAAPAVFLLHFFYVRDKYEKEPLRLPARVFFLSFFSIIPAGLLDAVVLGDDVAVWEALLVGLIEEGVKLAFVWWLVFAHEELDEPYDAILYSVTVSLSFATVENIGYALSFGGGVLIARALLAVPGHALWGVTIGYFLGRAKFGPPEGRSRAILAAYLAPAVGHGLTMPSPSAQPSWRSSFSGPSRLSSPSGSWASAWCGHTKR